MNKSKKGFDASRLQKNNNKQKSPQLITIKAMMLADYLLAGISINTFTRHFNSQAKCQCQAKPRQL